MRDLLDDVTQAILTTCIRLIGVLRPSLSRLIPLACILLCIQAAVSQPPSIIASQIPAAPVTTSSPPSDTFTLTGLTSPATVTESIFVNASRAAGAVRVDFFIDNTLVDTQRLMPFLLGGGPIASPNGFSTRRLSTGRHILTATAALPGATFLTAEPIVLNIVPSINATFSNTLKAYPNHPTAQSQSLGAMLSKSSTEGAQLTSAEITVREAVLVMYANWGVDPSLDYQSDESSLLVSLIPTGHQAPVSPPAAPYSMAFSPDAPYYHAIPARWPRTELPKGYFKTLQLNTNQQGDGIGFGESVATASSPFLTVTSKWRDVASTLLTFRYRIQKDWWKQIPSTSVGDEDVIFIDPFTKTFISSYKTSLNESTGGPNGLYIDKPVPFDSLGAYGGCVAANIAPLGVMIQPGEVSNSVQPIRHALGGPVGRTWAARVFPATGRDAGILTSTNSCTGAGKTNTGLVPYGGVIQLDPNLDLSELTLTLPARRILEAIQTYGYYVVDFGCADIDIYTAIPEAELEPFGGLYGNPHGSGVQAEVESVLLANRLYVVAPLFKKQ